MAHNRQPGSCPTGMGLGPESEIFEAEDHAADSTPPPDVSFSDHYGRLAQSVRYVNLGRIMLSLIIGPGVVLVYWLAFWPARVLAAGVQNPIDSVLVPALAVWLALWMQLLALSFLYHAYQYCRAWIWRRRDNQGRHSEEPGEAEPWTACSWVPWPGGASC